MAVKEQLDIVKRLIHQIVIVSVNFCVVPRRDRVVADLGQSWNLVWVLESP